jgi:hypothetical protein
MHRPGEFRGREKERRAGGIISFVEWQREKQPNCEACREIHAGKGKDAPCETCIPKLNEDNEDALLVYSLCQNQVIMCMDGSPIDINIVAVERVMAIYGIEDQRDCLEKVLMVFRHFLEKQA